MNPIQDRSLINFLTGLKVNSDRTLILNPLDTQIYAVSNFYTPSLKISMLAQAVQNDLKVGKRITASNTREIDDTLAEIQNSPLRYGHEKLYEMIRAIYLEGFSILYAIQVDDSFQSLVTSQDASNLHSNINYVIESLGQFGNDYANIVTSLRAIDTDTMYLLSVIEGEPSAL